MDEPCPGFRVGDEIALPPGVAVVDGRAFVTINNVTTAVRSLPPNSDLDQYGVERLIALSAGRRTIAVNPSGRARNFIDACRDMAWPRRSTSPCQSGPRTASYCVDRAARVGGSGFVADHDLWVANSGIAPGDRSVYEDQVLAKALQLGATVDGLNLKNLAMAELLFRRRQLIMEVHSENVKNPDWGGWEHYTSESRNGAAALWWRRRSRRTSRLSSGRRRPSPRSAARRARFARARAPRRATRNDFWPGGPESAACLAAPPPQIRQAPSFWPFSDPLAGRQVLAF